MAKMPNTKPRKRHTLSKPITEEAIVLMSNFIDCSLDIDFRGRSTRAALTTFKKPGFSVGMKFIRLMMTIKKSTRFHTLLIYAFLWPVKPMTVTFSKNSTMYI